MNDTTSLIASTSNQSEQPQDPEPTSFPLTALITSRNEHKPPLKLEIFEPKQPQRKSSSDPEFFSSENISEYWQPAEIPKELCGHMMIAGPVGSFASKPPEYKKEEEKKEIVCPQQSNLIAPAQDGLISLLNGDGMIYRLDFQTKPYPDTKDTDPNVWLPEEGKVYLSCQIAKAPDYHIDQILYDDSQESCKKYNSILRFIDVGLARISPFLGGRNFLNTAFLPLPSTDPDDSTRLVVTWDAGRPYEIDPRSLKLVGPIGLQRDWRFMVGLPPIKPKPNGEATGEKIGEKNDDSLIAFLQDVLGPEQEINEATVGGPFYNILTAAHPQFDANTGEFFSVNAVKSLRQMLRVNRFVRIHLSRWVSKKLNLSFLKPFIALLIWLLERVKGFLERKDFFGTYDVFLVRWKVEKDQKTNIQRWRLVEETSKKSILVKQALHQMGITKDYIVFADVAFKFCLEDFIPATSPSPIFRAVRSGIFSLLNYPQRWYVPIYLVPRKYLKGNESQKHDCNNDNDIPAIPVKRVKPQRWNLIKTLFNPDTAINPETAHFLTDYDNPNDLITIHAAHTIATDPAEFIREPDKYFKDDESKKNSSRAPSTPDGDEAKENTKETTELRKRVGMLVAPMDAGLLGSWSIDAKNGRVLSSKFTDKKEASQRIWYPSICAWRGDNQCGHASPGKFTDIYWMDYGVWPQLASHMVYQLYKKHRNRIIKQKEMDKILANGKPAALVRSTITRKKNGEVSAVEIVDRYTFPHNFFNGTPQFIPRGEGATNGYLVCTALWDESKGGKVHKKSEVWIFDAAKLHEGPCYRMYHDDLNIGMTIHSTWLKTLGTPPKRTDYEVKKDYKDLVESVERFVTPKEFNQVVELFEKMYVKDKEAQPKN